MPDWATNSMGGLRVLTKLGLPQKSEFVLAEVSTTRSSGWMSDQRAKLLLILSPNG